MKKIVVIAISLVFCLPLAAANLINNSGRWLQVDCQNASGRDVDTLNMQDGDNQQIPSACSSLSIRVNGKSINIGSYKTIVITSDESLVGR